MSYAIERVIRSAGFGTPVGYGGHGIGRAMHEEPHVPNTGRPGTGLPLREGLVLAIEPMVIAGGSDANRALLTAGLCSSPTAAAPRTPSTRLPSSRMGQSC